MAVALLSSPAAHAQIEHENPAKIKAANRRALREAARAEDGPYKDSHLDVTPDQLKRGASKQVQPEGSEKLRYNGTAPNVKPPGFLGLRRSKTTTVVRREQRRKPRGQDKTTGSDKK